MRLARTLGKRGTVAIYAGDPAAALRLHRQAAELLDPTTAPALCLMTQHNLADDLVELGRAEEAAAMVAANSALYAAHDDPDHRLRRSWLLERIARARERFAEAEGHLAETRNACLVQGLGYDLALVSLDLAELYLTTGRTAEVKTLARQMAPVFASQGVHREALAALLLFQNAAAGETLTANFVARLQRYLVLARNDPSFRFEAGVDGAVGEAKT